MKRADSHTSTAYQALTDITKNKFGMLQKACLHIHTPASHDYKLFEDWTEETYASTTANTLYSKCVDHNIIPPQFTFDMITLGDDDKVFEDHKEFLSYLLIANALRDYDISIVLIADHHTIAGYDKLLRAIKFIHKHKHYRIYPEVILGIEISCADHNHVVGVFDNTQTARSSITEWLNDHLINKKLGTYETSYAVLSALYAMGGIGYIAHIDQSNMFKENKYLSGAYKKKLFEGNNTSLVGVANPASIPQMNTKIQNYKKGPVRYIIDNDAHCIEELAHSHTWVKCAKGSFLAFREALEDYDISVSFAPEETGVQSIRGIYIENSGDGFLQGNSTGGNFALTFSPAMNCLIGGRGTGKSTVLELLEFVLSQRYQDERRLDFLCKYSFVWVLYRANNMDYLIEFVPPVKEDPSDAIRFSFGIRRHRNYYERTNEAQTIKECALQKYIHVYETEIQEKQLFLKPVGQKEKFLNSLFEARYSVNQLVNIAGSEELSGFISEIILKNRSLSTADWCRAKSAKGLIASLDKIETNLSTRSEEVNDLLRPFNKNQKSGIQIVYSQNSRCVPPDIASWIYGRNFLETHNYRSFTQIEEAFIEYFTILYERKGLFDFLRLVISGNVEEMEKIEKLIAVISSMVEDSPQDVTSRYSEEWCQHELTRISKQFSSKETIESIVVYLRAYLDSIEQYELKFNVHVNHAGSAPLYRSVSDLSLGQKVVAMLSFILGYGEYSNDYRPLIIDQPEDNLDSQYIYTTLVSMLRQVKFKRQVIIATHNATLVTNAKAEQVCVMQSDNIHGWIETTGFPGEKRIKEHILNYLEGGKESFKHKESIYRDVL